MWFDKAKEMISQVEGDVGLLVKNLNTGEAFAYNADMVFPSASVIKVFILLALMDEAAAGRIDISEAVLSNPGSVGGCGVVDHLGAGLPFTLRDYAVFMTVLSDNAATNTLISALGLEAINAKIQEIGAKDTVLNRKMMDFEAIKQGRNNYTTCNDILAVFSRFHSDQVKYADALGILKSQQHKDMLVAFMVGNGEEISFAHKTGTLPGVRHDAGIMYIGGEPIFVSFLTRGLKNNVYGTRLANDIGLMIYENFKR